MKNNRPSSCISDELTTSWVIILIIQTQIYGYHRAFSGLYRTCYLVWGFLPETVDAAFCNGCSSFSLRGRFLHVDTLKPYFKFIFNYKWNLYPFMCDLDYTYILGMAGSHLCIYTVQQHLGLFCYRHTLGSMSPQKLLLKFNPHCEVGGSGNLRHHNICGWNIWEGIKVKCKYKWGRTKRTVAS